MSEPNTTQAQSFECPNCGAPVPFTGDQVLTRCSYCRSSVPVPETLRPWAGSTTPEGKYVTRFGSSGSAPGQFNQPDAIAIDSQGRIYVADGHRIQVFSPDGRYLNAFQVNSFPFSLAFNDKDELFVLVRTQVVKYVLNGQ